MECINHNVVAKCICINCGKALCLECNKTTNSGKVFCSSECASTIERFDAAIDQIANKTKSISLASAYGSYLMGIIAIGYAVITEIQELSFLAGAIGVGMVIMGFLYHRLYLKKSKL